MRSTFPSQNVQNTPGSTFGSWDVEKVHAAVARSNFFQVKMLKTPDVQTTFGRSDVVFHGQRKGFPSIPKTMAGVGHLKRIWKDALSLAGAIQKTCPSEMLISWEGGAFWSIRSSAMNLCDKCSTSYALASLFRGRRSTLDRRSGKNAKRICTRPSALQSSFHFWRKSRRFASFLMLPTSKIEEISQNCFRFDAVKFKNWGSLANLLLFWCCQTQKLRKSRGIASFSSLQIDW